MISTPNGHPSGYTKNKKKRFSIKRLAKLLIPLFSTKSSPSVGDATLTTNHPITPLPPPPPVFNPFPGTRLIRYVCMLREELDFYLIPFNSADGFSSAAAASYSSSTNDTAPSPSNNNRLSRLPFYLRWMGSSSSNSNNNKKHNTSNSSVLQFSKSESRLRIHGMAPSSSLTQQQQPPLPSEFAHSSTSALMEGCSGAASNTSVLSLGEKIEDENVALVKVLVGEELARRRKINPASSLATATFVLSGNSSSNLAKANDVSSGKAGNLASPPHPFLGRFKSGSSTGSGAGGAANTNNSQSSFLSQQTQLPRAGSTESITNSSSAATQNVFLGALSAHAHSCDDWMFRELEKSKNKLMSVAMMCLKSEKEVTPLSDVEEKLRKDLASTMDNISSATSALASGDTGRGGIGGVAHQTQSQQPSPSTPSATNLTKDSSPQPSLITSVQQQSNIVTSTAGIYNAIASHKPVRKCWWETTVVHIDGSEFNQKKRRFSQSSHATGGDMGAGGGEGEGSDAAGDIMSAAAEGVSGSGRVASENRQAAYSKHGGAGASHQMNRTTAAVTSASSFHQYSLDQAVRQDILPPLVSRESVVSTASSANTVEYSNPDMDSEMPVNAGTSSSNNNSSSMPQAGSAPSYSNSSPILNLDVPLPPQSTSSTPGGSKNNGTTPPKKPKTNTGSKSSFISKSKNKAKNKTNKVKKSSKQASGGQENLDNNHSDEEIPFKRLEVRVWLRRAWIIEYCQV